MSLVYAENSDEIGCALHVFMCDQIVRYLLLYVLEHKLPAISIATRKYCNFFGRRAVSKKPATPHKLQKCRVVYRGGSSPFFGIGILRYQISSVSVFSVSILGV